MRRTIALAAALLLAGCGSEEGDASYISAVIDGQVWSAEALEGEVAYYVEGGDGIWTMARRPLTNGGQFFSLVVPKPPAVGTYPLDEFIARAGFASCPDDVLADCISWSAIPEDPGTLEIDHIDPATGLIEGKFSFIGYALGDPEGAKRSFTRGRFRFFAPGAVGSE
jgi:hypothetical protein